MNNPKVKLLLLISLLAALGTVISAFAAGSHFQIGFNDGAFNFDFKVATSDSGAASVLGVIALAAGLIGIGLHVSRGSQAGGEAAAGPGATGSSGFLDFAGALHLLATTARQGVPLAELAAVMTRYPQVLVNVRGVDKARVASAPELAAAVAAAEQELGTTGRVLGQI